MSNLPKEITSMKKGDNGRMMLLMGPSGVGKTHQIGTLVEANRNVLIANAENKLETIDYMELNDCVWPINGVDFPETPDQKRAMISSGASDMMKIIEYLRTPDHPFDDLVIESGMGYVENLYSYLCAENVGDKWAGFNALARKVPLWMNLLKQLTDSTKTKKPVNVVVTWGVTVGEDWEGKRRWVPIIPGRANGPRVPYYFSDVLMLLKRGSGDDVEYVMHTEGTHEFDAKVSTHLNIPAIIGKPDLNKLIEKLGGVKYER